MRRRLENGRAAIVVVAAASGHSLGAPRLSARGAARKRAIYFGLELPEWRGNGGGSVRARAPHESLISGLQRRQRCTIELIMSPFLSGFQPVDEIGAHVHSSSFRLLARRQRVELQWRAAPPIASVAPATLGFAPRGKAAAPGNCTKTTFRFATLSSTSLVHQSSRGRAVLRCGPRMVNKLPREEAE